MARPAAKTGALTNKHAGLEAARAELEPLRANATKYVLMDVANEASVIAGLDGCEDGFGPVRGLVNSAGIARDVPFFDTSVELFRKVLDINLIGTFTVAREAGRLMKNAAFRYKCLIFLSI